MGCSDAVAGCSGGSKVGSGPITWAIAAEPSHIPVLMNHVLAMHAPRPGQTYLDATAGLGGHAAAVGERLGRAGTVVLMDLDGGNLERAAARVRGLPEAPTVHALQGSFSQAARRMGELGLRADLVLADLGFASNQIAEAGRGFSFMNDGPLDMRLDPTSPITAAELVNTMPERELGALLREFGEEPNARRIARKLAQEREGSPILTTAQLARAVRAAIPARDYSGIDPATRTFQALRIAVNDEIGNLTGLLGSIERSAEANRRGEATWLARGARIGIISFHSLEDRPVKQAFASLVERDLARHLTRKPLTADETELTLNPRSRSAKLRVIELADGTDSSQGLNQS